MELGAQNHNGDGLLGPNSIIVVYTDPLGILVLVKNPAMFLPALKALSAGSFLNTSFRGPQSKPF